MGYSNLNGGKLKWQMLSAHDTNVALISANLNITNHECQTQKHQNIHNYLQCEKPPRYTANLILEFHENETKDQFVKARYNGKYAFLCEK